MKVKIADTCGNSPRSKLVAELAVWLRDDKYENVNPWLADGFVWMTPGGENSITKSGLKSMMYGLNKSDIRVEQLEVITAISHGKYAAVSSVSRTTNGMTFYVHDLYEFTGVGKDAKLLKLTSYVVDSK